MVYVRTRKARHLQFNIYYKLKLNYLLAVRTTIVRHRQP